MRHDLWTPDNVEFQNETYPLLSVLWAICISYVLPYNCETLLWRTQFDNVSMSVFPILDIV